MQTEINLVLTRNCKSIFFCFVFCLISFSNGSIAQQTKYTAANAHAHNDYLHPLPFYTAYNAGFGSIEADVFPVDGILCVAHSKKEIQPERTLRELYLMPLVKELSKDTSRRVKLLVDIKENYKVSLSLLLKELEPLKKFLSSEKKYDRLTILISGDRPLPSEYKNYPGYIFFDDDLKLRHTTEEWNRVGLVSLPFNKISEWKGEDNINRRDKKRLRNTIDSVHFAGKPIRFWAAPDTKTSWKLQVKLHADLIGTDKIDELANFFRH